MNQRTRDSQVAFKPIKRTFAVDSVIGQLEDHILNGTLEAGIMLPSASELATQFGVSQRSVNEALKVLEAKGLVEVRMGVGAFVMRNDLDVFLSSLTRSLSSYLRINRADFQDVKGLRLLIEGAALEFAVNSDSKSLLDSLDSNIAAQRTAFQNQDFSTYQSYHFQFHYELVDTLQNRLISMIYRQVLDLMRGNMEKAGSNPSVMLRAIEEHQNIIDAVRSKAANEHLKRLLEGHLDGFVHNLAANENQEDS